MTTTWRRRGAVLLLAPPSPVPLFEQWLLAAVEAGVPEAHAMTLSTVAGGSPDARVLVLKDLDPGGRWAFAGSAESAKGRQLATEPAAALTFWWQPLVRSVRIRGAVAAGTAEENDADFRARSRGARAIALSGRQSTPLADAALLDRDLAAAEQRLEAQPDLAADFWRKYWVTATSVEFWQGQPSRKHARLRYARRGDGWDRTLLRP